MIWWSHVHICRSILIVSHKLSRKLSFKIPYRILCFVSLIRQLWIRCRIVFCMWPGKISELLNSGSFVRSIAMFVEVFLGSIMKITGEVVFVERYLWVSRKKTISPWSVDLRPESSTLRTLYSSLTTNGFLIGFCVGRVWEGCGGKFSNGKDDPCRSIPCKFAVEDSVYFGAG